VDLASAVALAGVDLDVDLAANFKKSFLKFV